jgi:hypothetical protein
LRRFILDCELELSRIGIEKEKIEWEIERMQMNGKFQ